MAHQSPYFSHAAWLAAIDHLINGPEHDVKPTLERLYSKDCAVTANGNKMNLNLLVDYILSIRKMVDSAEIIGLCWLRDGRHFAEKHTVAGKYKDGSTGSVIVPLHWRIGCGWKGHLPRGVVSPGRRVINKQSCLVE